MYPIRLLKEATRLGTVGQGAGERVKVGKEEGLASTRAAYVEKHHLGKFTWEKLAMHLQILPQHETYRKDDAGPREETCHEW